MTTNHAPHRGSEDDTQTAEKPLSVGVELVFGQRQPPTAQRTGRADLVFRERVRRPEPRRAADPISE
ncbi:hypothetical protein LJR175_004395 [Variovorax sp. LjRoot175]|uniref:hypothetical protein n=1 Tax=Variovorax sp. LjRoot175 TaxID=3342276 RepID=UPI003ECF8278